MKNRFLNQNRFKIFCILLVMTLISVFVQGYSLVESDNTIYLPLIKYLNNKSLYPDDPSLLHLLKMPYPLYWIIALISKFADLTIIYFVLHLFVRFLLLAAVFCLSFYLFKDETSSMLSVALVAMVNGGTLAVFDITSRILIQHTFVLPFLLFSILLFLKERYLLSFLLLGIISNFHVLFGAITMFLYLSYFFRRCKDFQIRPVIIGVLIFFLFASPSLVKTLINLDSAITKDWYELSEIRMYHHVLPFSWTLGNYFSFFSLFLLYMASLKYKPKNKIDAKVNIFLFGILILAVIGTVFTELIPIPVIMRSMLFRSIVIFKIFALMYISNYLINSLKEKIYWKNITIFGILASLFLMPSQFEPRFLFPLTLLLFSFDMKKNRVIKKVILALSSIIFILLIFGTFMPLFKGSYFDINRTIGTFQEFRFLVIIFIFLALLILNKLKLTFTASLIAVMLVLGALNTSTSQPGFIRLNYKLPINEWEDINYWIRDNIASNASFITPPYLEGFSAFSERKTLTDWKMCGQGFWQPSYANICWPMLRELKCNAQIDKCISGYGSLTEKDFIKVSKRYNAKFAIIEKPKHLDFPSVYENKNFVLYRIE